MWAISNGSWIGVTEIDKDYKDLATAVSHLTGRTISRFTHVHQNIEDLIKKIKLLRVLGQKTATCFQRCVGHDGIKIARLIEAMTGGTALVESMHGAGSPQAQRVMIFREGQLDKKIRLAKALLGIPVKGGGNGSDWKPV